MIILFVCISHSENFHGGVHNLYNSRKIVSHMCIHILIEHKFMLQITVSETFYC